MGRVRGLDLRHGLGAVLVCRHDSRPRPAARPVHRRRPAAARLPLRPVRHGLARLQPPLEQLRDGLPDPRRHRHAAGALGAHHRVVRLRRLADPRLAHDDLPALFRRGRDLFGLRHGAHAHPAAARRVQARGPGDAVPHRQHVQDHLGDRFDGGLRLHDGVLHRVVRREPQRGLHLHQPRVRPLRLGLLDHGHLQRHRAAVLLVQGRAPQHRDGLGPLPPGQRGHVDRALRDHLHLAGPRLPALELGLSTRPRSSISSRSSARSACSARFSSCSSASCP